MSLQFILGPAGSGKSEYLYRCLCKSAETCHSERFFVLVPEQFTLETQKICVNKSKGRGIMNLDVLSFHRLACRVFEQVPARKRTVLEDMGKMMLVRKVLLEQRRRLKYFRKGLDKPGFLDELKSFLCELILYRVKPQDMESMIQSVDRGSLMEYKLKDLKLVYTCFMEKLDGQYVTAEEILPQLSGLVSEIEMLWGSTIALDGFTGFTPSQYELIRELLRVCKKMYITLDLEKAGGREDLFFLSHKTIFSMTKLAGKIGISVEEPVYTGKGKDKLPYRFQQGGELLHLERNLFSLSGRAMSGSTGEIRLLEAGSPKSEVACAIKEMERLISEEGFRYGEIAVITGRIETYREFFAMELERRNIRYFIDCKQNIGANACAEFILSMLEMFHKDFDYETTFRFLRCGLSPLEREETDLLENYVLAQGIRTFSGYRKEWTYVPDHRRDCDLDSLNRIRITFIHSVEEIREKFRGGKKTVETYVRILYEALLKHQIYNRLLEREKAFEEAGQLLLAKEYQSVYKIMMDLFDQMVELLGEEEISFREFVELLQSGILGGLVGFVPPVMDQVVIGDMERSRLAHIRVLFLLGANDGLVPKPFGGPGILSERERARLEESGFCLAPGVREQILTSQFYMYLALTRPSERLYLSYFRKQEDGSEARPSYLVRKLRLLFPELEIETDMKKTPEDYLGSDMGKKFLLQGLASCRIEEPSMAWYEIFRYHKIKNPDWIGQVLRRTFEKEEETVLSREAVDLIYGDLLPGSVTRLERYERCPYSHFAAYGLELGERQLYQIGMPDFGNVFHEVLERLAAELAKAKIRWRDIQPKQMDEWIEKNVEKSVAEYRNEMFNKDRRTAYISKRMNRILKRTVCAIAGQMRAGRYEQSGYEVSFDHMENMPETSIALSDGKKMKLKGRIDRMDTYETEDQIFVRIVDYKTGAARFDLSSLYYGLQMQLAIYLQVAASLENRHGKEVVPAGMLYYRISDPVVSYRNGQSAEQREAERYDELRMGGFVAGEFEILQSMDRIFGEGSGLTPSVESSVIPVATGKDGQIKTGRGMIGSRMLLSGLLRNTSKRLQEAGNEIVEGHKEVRPVLHGAGTGCDFCAYSGVCGFDAENPGDAYRKLEQLSIQEVTERLKEETNKGESG